MMPTCLPAPKPVNITVMQPKGLTLVSGDRTKEQSDWLRVHWRLLLQSTRIKQLFGNERKHMITSEQHRSDDLVTVDLLLACACDRSAGREYFLDPMPKFR